MGRIALVPGSTREPRHQFLDWPASQSGLAHSAHHAVGFPYETQRIVGDGSGSGGYAWRTYTFETGQTRLFIRFLLEIEAEFLLSSQGTILQLLNASDAVVGQLYILTSSGHPHVTQVRHGGALVAPYIGGTALMRGVTKETWIAWKAASGPGTNDGYWLVMGGHAGIYAIQRDWLNSDGTSVAEQVRKLRIGWLSAGTNPAGTLHIHELDVWDAQPTELSAIYPTAGQTFFEDAPAIVTFDAPPGHAVGAVEVGPVGGSATALPIHDATGERTNSTGTSDGVDDNGGLHCPALFNAAPGQYDGCLVEGAIDSLALFPPAQILWHRAESGNYKAHLHPIHPLCVTPPGKRGTLTTRTSDTVGELTMEASHGIATGNTIHVYWASGKRIGVTVGTVSGNVVPISGGAGAAGELPSRSEEDTGVQTGRLRPVCRGASASGRQTGAHPDRHGQSESGVPRGIFPSHRGSKEGGQCMWFCYLKTTAGSVLALLALSGLTGCATLNPQPPVEAFANKLADEAIIPAVREGLSQGVEQLVIQAGAQGINPTYVVKFSGKWVTGVEGAASVGVEGIAGQLQVSSASSAGEPRAGAAANESSPPQKEPAARPTSQPTGVERSAATGTVPTPAGTILVTITDVDRDEDKGFARLPDGTLVMVPGAPDRLGQTVVAEITARAGRLVTARLVDGQ